MKKLHLYLTGALLLALSTQCFAEEVLPDYEVGKTRTVIDTPENNPIKQAALPTFSNVNLLTGEFVENSCDFTVAGAEQLSVNRFYNHLSLHDSRYGGWRFNPESFVVGNFEWGGQAQFISFGEHSGQIHLFDKHIADTFSLNNDQMQSYSNFLVNAPCVNNHLLNTSVNYRKVVDPKNKSRFTWQGEITDGTGSVRSFSSVMHRWHDRVKPASRSKHYFTPNVWIPYMLPVTEERRPNGTFLKYTYESLSHNVYPQYGLLKSITALNNSKSKVIGSLTFNYHAEKTGNISSFEVTGSDGRKARFTHTDSDPVFLGNVKAAGQPLTSFSYARNFLSQIEKPDSRLQKNVYDPQNLKLLAQYASVSDEAPLSAVARFTYLNDSTKVLDGNGNQVVYYFDQNKRLSTIEKYDGDEIYSIQRNTWDTKTGNLLMSSIEDGHGQIFKQQEYVYDNRHNIVEETFGDASENSTIFRTYSRDGRNLKLSETDGIGNTTNYSYVAGTNLVARKLIYDQDTISMRTFYTYDDCAVCTKKIVDDGQSINPYDLTDVTYRKITYTHPKTSTPCMGLPEVVEEKTIDEEGNEILLSRVAYKYHPSGQVLQEDHFDNEGKHRYCILNSYDEEERLVTQTDALGNLTTREYDANHNLIALSGPRADTRTTWTYDRANRPIREEVWVDNTSTLVTTKSYDNMGNLKSNTDPYGQTTSYVYDAFNRLIQTTFADGSIESKEYDILGNVTKEMDANGHATTTTHNFLSQITSITYPDGSLENFAYFPNGSLYSHTERNGATSFYTNDNFNNPTKTIVRSRAGRLLKTTQATFSPFRQLSYTDPEGVTTYYKYDFAGRKIAESTGERTINFQYDSLGRLTKTIKGDIVSVQEYDLLGHILDRRTEDLSKKISLREQYLYDPAGNCTHVTTCYGTTEKQYNALGQVTLIKEPGDLLTYISYQYDDILTKITTDPDDKQTEELFDRKGQLLRKQVVDHERKILFSEEKSYDPCGNVVVHLQDVYQGIEEKQYKTIFAYGTMNRLEKKIENEQRETTYAYDNNGRVKTLRKPDGTMLFYNHDDLGKLSRMYSSTKDIDYTYTYDRNMNLLSAHDRKHSTTTSRAYDSYGNLTQEILANNLTLSNSYDPFGKRTALQLPDGSEVHYTYRGNQLYEVIRNENTYTYEERDLEGNPTRILLPQELESISIERNNRGLWDSCLANHLKITNTSYNSSGKLQSCKVSDPLGEIDIQQTYDSLGYLTGDGEHTYNYNSLGIRTGKDDQEFELDKFCQITTAGKRCYSYDANGNLISDGEKSYSYDSLDRLTSIAFGKTLLKFTYDPFHRRLKEEVFQNKVLTDFHHFMWDDQEEIGCAVQAKRIVELRVLGDRINTACPLAVAHEFDGKMYTPLYDHQGSVLTLVDTATNKPVETYRYTAYGEKVAGGNATPWRFLNHRFDSSTSFIYGNKVYYDPALGSYLTGNKTWPNPYLHIAR